VHFMAETSKVLCPDKTVLIPDLRAGCSLASSISAADVRLIRQRFPGLPVVTYVNTTAEVKAETDVCCTSANAVQVVEHVARAWGVDRVILIPDEFLARNVARQTDVKIIAWQGRCEVHERFDRDDILELRAAYPNAEILAHPECPTEVLELSDFAGSTAAMNDYVMQRKPRQVVLITECSMADNVACDAPDTEFVRPCNLCPHMKRISLDNIYEALLNDRYEVTIDADIAERARLSVQRMIDLPPPERPARRRAPSRGGWLRRVCLLPARCTHNARASSWSIPGWPARPPPAEWSPGRARPASLPLAPPPARARSRDGAGRS